MTTDLSSIASSEGPQVPSPPPEVVQVQESSSEDSSEESKKIGDSGVTGQEVPRKSAKMKSPKSKENEEEEYQCRNTLETERHLVRAAMISGTLVCLGLALHNTAVMALRQYPMIYSMASAVDMKPVSECERIRSEAIDWASLASTKQCYFYIVYYVLETVMAACLFLVVLMPETDPDLSDHFSDHPVVVLRKKDYNIFTSVQRIGAYLLQQSVFVMVLSWYVFDRHWVSPGPLLLFDDTFWYLWASKGALFVLYFAIHVNREFVDVKHGGRTVLQWIIDHKFDPTKDIEERVRIWALGKNLKKRPSVSSVDDSREDDLKKASEALKSEGAEEKPQAGAEANGSEKHETGRPPSPWASDQLFKIGGTQPETSITPNCQSPD